jgi:glycosyltransferase involved in cell wall biosynthesis
MACGVPLVATTGGALPEVVGPDGISARTVAPNDPSALAAAILELLNDPEQRARIGASGRDRVLDRFTWRASALGMVENWQALLEQRVASRGAR